MLDAYPDKYRLVMTLSLELSFFLVDLTLKSKTIRMLNVGTCKLLCYARKAASNKNKYQIHNNTENKLVWI